MRKSPGYHIIYGDIERRERERKKEADRFWREQQRIQRTKLRREREKQMRVSHHNSSPYSTYSSSESTSEDRVIKVVVSVFFLIVGIGAIILSFVFDFWTLFKIIFIMGGLFAISIAWYGITHEQL